MNDMQYEVEEFVAVQKRLAKEAKEHEKLKKVAEKVRISEGLHLLNRQLYACSDTGTQQGSCKHAERRGSRGAGSGKEGAGDEEGCGGHQEHQNLLQSDCEGKNTARMRPLFALHASLGHCLASHALPHQGLSSDTCLMAFEDQPDVLLGASAGQWGGHASQGHSQPAGPRALGDQVRRPADPRQVRPRRQDGPHLVQDEHRPAH